VSFHHILAILQDYRETGITAGVARTQSSWSLIDYSLFPTRAVHSKCVVCSSVFENALGKDDGGINSTQRNTKHRTHLPGERRARNACAFHVPIHSSTQSNTTTKQQNNKTKPTPTPSPKPKQQSNLL
jgi:hypothetical protein